MYQVTNWHLKMQYLLLLFTARKALPQEHPGRSVSCKKHSFHSSSLKLCVLLQYTIHICVTQHAEKFQTNKNNKIKPAKSNTTFVHHISSKGIVNSLQNMTPRKFKKQNKHAECTQLQLSVKIFDFIVLELQTLWRGPWLRLRPVIELWWRGCRHLLPAWHTSGQTQGELSKSTRPCWMSRHVWSWE